MKDVDEIILPGITHWQHPSFFAFFPANSSRISVLAEMLTSTLAAQCMIWQTSPAAAELEERVMEWLARHAGAARGLHRRDPGYGVHGHLERAAHGAGAGHPVRGEPERTLGQGDLHGLRIGPDPQLHREGP